MTEAPHVPVLIDEVVERTFATQPGERITSTGRSVQEAIAPRFLLTGAASDRF